LRVIHRVDYAGSGLMEVQFSAAKSARLMMGGYLYYKLDRATCQKWEAWPTAGPFVLL